MVFQNSVLPFAGNASQTDTIAPLHGAVELYYGTYTIPAASGSGPGYVVIALKAQVVARAVSGAYTIDAQATDSNNDIAHLDSAAAITVNGVNASATP